MAEKMAAHFRDDDFQQKLNNHFCTFSMWNFTKIEEEIYEDEAGVLWDKSKDKDIGIVCNRLIPTLEERNYRLPGLDREFVQSGLSWLKENKGDKFCLFDIGLTLYERSWTLRGAENVLMDMIDNPSSLHELLDEISNYLHDALDMALACDFVDGVLFGDDWGSQRGLIMGKARWLEFFKPRFKSLYGKVKSAGKYTFHHSCGYIEDIFKDLIEIGLDCYQTFQPEVYDITKVKAEYGKDMAFWGGISTQRLLPYEPSHIVAEETARTIRVMGTNGGYIAAPAHDVPGDVPVENLLAMWKVFENQLRK
jgi:uroporphyrinogen decarboxylase